MRVPTRDNPMPLPLHFTTLPPLSLYVHLPWCVRKCPYCDFNSHAADGDLPEADYVDALLADLERDLPLVWGRQIETIFFGGGTPSLFSPDALDQLLSGIRARLPLAPFVEVTLEANPGTLESGRFQAFRALGINRLSIGVQSFDDVMLERLGRIHGAAQARAAVESALQAGFDSFNVDLMFGLPGQNTEAALQDLETALEYAPPPGMPDNDMAGEMEDVLRARLEEAGLARYEISAHARPGMRARHNLNYWRFGDYLGIGAGAHGKITSPGGILRTTKPRGPAQYMEQALAAGALGDQQAVPPKSLPFEFALNVFRLVDGVETRLFEERTGLPLLAIKDALAKAESAGLIRRDLLTMAPTQKGLQFLNNLVVIFLPPT